MDQYLEDDHKKTLALVLMTMAVIKAKKKTKFRKNIKAKSIWLLQRQHHGWYEKLINQLEEGDMRSFKHFLSVDPEMFRNIVAASV